MFILCLKHQFPQTPLLMFPLKHRAHCSACSLDLHYCFHLWNVFFFLTTKPLPKERGCTTRSISTGHLQLSLTWIFFWFVKSQMQSGPQFCPLPFPHPPSGCYVQFLLNLLISPNLFLLATLMPFSPPTKDSHWKLPLLNTHVWGWRHLLPHSLLVPLLYTFQVSHLKWALGP